MNLGQYFPVVHRWLRGGAEQLFLHTRFWDPPLPQFSSVWGSQRGHLPRGEPEFEGKVGCIGLRRLIPGKSGAGPFRTLPDLELVRERLARRGGDTPWKQVAFSLRPKFEFQFHLCDTAHREESHPPPRVQVSLLGPVLAQSLFSGASKRFPAVPDPGGKGPSWWAQVMAPVLCFCGTLTGCWGRN